MIEIKKIKPSYSIITPADEIIKFPQKIELAGRVCYKSEHKIDENSYKTFVRNIIKSGHDSVLEHCSLSVLFTISRACSHQLVRHRLASFSQESQRYVNYKNKSVIKVIIPESLESSDEFNDAVSSCIRTYENLIRNNIKPEDARYCLPNCIATDIVCTANIREWRHIFKIRTESKAQWEIREVLVLLLNELNSMCGELFEDLVDGPEVVP